MSNENNVELASILHIPGDQTFAGLAAVIIVGEELCITLNHLKFF